MKLIRLILTATVALAASNLIAASIAVTPEVATLGLGASVGIGLTPMFGVRVAAHTGHYSHNLKKENIDYNGKLKLNNVAALLDLYPGGSGFRLSGGAFSNSDKIDLTSKPGGTITVNGVAYPSAAVGNITGDVKFDKTSPYLGIGWGGKPSGRGFGLTFDLGVLYQGSPKLRVQANPTNPALVPPSFYTNLEAERAKTEHDIRSYRYYPVVGVGFSIGF